jgi:hypothetical protein
MKLLAVICQDNYLKSPKRRNHRWLNDINVDFRGTGWVGTEWIYLA